MNLQEFIDFHQLGRGSPKYMLVQKDWDDFIQKYDGINCKKMCKKTRPNRQTVQLFQNNDASNIFCRWCL